MSGYLKAIWPDFLGAFLRSGRPRGPGKSFQNVGGEDPHIFEGLPGLRGRPDFKNAPPKTRPDCLQVPSMCKLIGPYVQLAVAVTAGKCYIGDASRQDRRVLGGACVAAT